METREQALVRAEIKPVAVRGEECACHTWPTVAREGTIARCKAGRRSSRMTGGDV